MSDNDIPLLALPHLLDDELMIIRPLSRRSRHLRLAIFLLLQIAYLSLAIACYRKPIFLPNFLTLNQGKGLVTVFSIVWQTLAVIPVSVIATFVFSGEWSVQLLRTGQLVPGSTDKVSTLTATYFDRLVHFVAKSASTSFRLAFLASLALIGLTSLAPGTFFTSLLPLPTPIKVQIGNLTFDNSFSTILFVIDRPAVITRLEQIENFRVGYDVQPNWIVGWPPLDLPVNGTLQYPSDGIHFQYQCSWRAPVIAYQDGLIANVTTADGSWDFWDSVGDQEPTLSPYSAVLLPLTQAPGTTTSLSAFLFLGSNSSLHEASRVSPFDLSGLPTTYLPSGFIVTKTNTTNSYLPPLASVLVCDPKMNIFSVNVVRQTNLTLRLLSQNNNNPPVVGNIPETTASLLFAFSLLSATSPAQPFINDGILVNYLAASLFMSNPTVSSDTLTGGTDPLSTRPLDLSTINANMNAYVLSASKAYAPGYLSSYGSGATFATLPVSGTVEVQRLALETNMPYFIVTVVLVGVTMVLLEALTVGGEGGVPFTLGSVVKEVQQGLQDGIVDGSVDGKCA